MIIKSQIVLYLYDKLVAKEKLYIDEIIGEYNISIRTFRRYISEINAFLCNNYKNQFVSYDYKNKYYYLKESF